MSEPERIPDYPDSIRLGPMRNSESLPSHADQVEPARFAAIVFCPCCVTAKDVEGANGMTLALECVSCGQPWKMVVSEERQAAHSVN